MSAITDNFNDGITLPLWRAFENGGNPIVEQNGTVDFQMGIGLGTSELRTEPAFDLRESSVSIAAVSSDALVAGSEILELESIDYDRLANRGQSLRMALIGDQLLAQYTDNTTALQPDDPPVLGRGPLVLEDRPRRHDDDVVVLG